MSDRPKSAATKAQVRQHRTSINHLGGSGLGVAVIVTRCILRIGGSLRRWIGVALNFFTQAKRSFTKYPLTRHPTRESCLHISATSRHIYSSANNVLFSGQPGADSDEDRVIEATKNSVKCCSLRDKGYKRSLGVITMSRNSMRL
jgi:hypothetical protein